jgi:competence protein ComEA
VAERGWQAIGWAVAAVAAVLIGTRLLAADPAPPAVQVADGPTGAAGGRSGRRSPALVVHVTGAVRRPGIYRLSDGARVVAAVRRAGGPTARAETGLINLAARLEDGQQVVVPSAAGAVAAGVGSGGAAAAGSGGPAAPISLGSATVEQLDQLDGIGPTLAQRIVAHRQARGGFASLDQLAEVEGIGEQRLAALEQALVP